MNTNFHLPRSWTARSYDKSLFNLIRNCQPIFRSGHSTCYHHYFLFNLLMCVCSASYRDPLSYLRFVNIFSHSIACLFVLLFLFVHYKLYFMWPVLFFFFFLSKSQGSLCMSAGIKTPKRWELIISNTTFVNFDLTDCVSIRTCAGCSRGQGKLFEEIRQSLKKAKEIRQSLKKANIQVNVINSDKTFVIHHFFQL